MPHLQDQLDEITANTRTLVQPERLAINERAIEDLFATGIEQRILPVGAKAPDFVLQDSLGRLVKSSDLRALGPVILNFFRGRWCPYCITELEAWRDLYPIVRDHGGLLAAVSPQTVRQSDFTQGQHDIPFPLLYDDGCKVSEQFGLVYTIPPYHQQHYRNVLVNLPFVNGDQSWKLILPATYVLASDGTVLFAEAYADFRVRPEPEEVLRYMPVVKR
jgi:peroxiredoxin